MKFIRIVIVFLSLMLFVGCGEKYLTCHTKVANNDYLNVNKTVKLEFVRFNLTKSSIYLDYQFKNNNQSDIDSMKKQLTEECSLYKDDNGVVCFVSNLDDGVHLELTVTVDKLTEENKDLFNEMLSYKNYDDAEQKLRKEYICE